MIRFLLRTVPLLLATINLVGCTHTHTGRANPAGIDSSKPTFRISVYSGAWLAEEFRSYGEVTHYGNSDAWSFVDRSTGKVVRVSGTIVIEQE